MKIYQAQNIFNGGEISPIMVARADQPAYQAGLITCRNFVPLPQGGITRRPGFIFAGYTKNTTGNVRLVPFMRSARTLRMLEFGHLYMRVWLVNGSQQLNTAGTAAYEIATPYTSDDIPLLSITQSADVMFIASQNHQPAKISRYGDTDWRYSVLTFRPSISAPPYAPTLVAGGSVGGSGTQEYSYVVTAIDPETGEMSAASPQATITATSLSLTYYIDVSWYPVSGVTEYRVYRKKAGVFGFIGRALGGANTLRDANLGPDEGDTPPVIKTPFVGAGNYPSQVFFHQQRLGWASTNKRPLTIWMSQSANFESLASSVPPKDDDAIEATLAGRQTNTVTFVCPDRECLVIGTESGEYTMKPEGASVLTPSNVSFLPQSEKGSDVGLDAVHAGGSVIFIMRGGDGVFSSGYNFQADRYLPVDMSILSQHIFQGRYVVSWGYSQKPYGIIWLVLDDGTLAGLTTLPEHSITAWHRHDTDGFIETLAILPTADGDQDLLWCIVTRGNQRHVEILSPFFESDDKDTAYFVDGGGSYYGPARDTINNLNWLEGKTVDIFADGHIHTQQKVTNGTVKLEYAAQSMHIGLPYISTAQPTRPEVQLQQGSSIMQKRRVIQCLLRLYQTIGINVRMVDSSGKQSTLRNLLKDDINTWPVYTQLEDIRVAIAGAWDGSRHLEISVNTPTPATILALVSEVEL